MVKKHSKRFEGDRKYFAIVFFIFFIILLTGIITPYLSDFKRSSWKDELTEKISQIQSTVTQLFNERQSELITVSSALKKQLHINLSTKSKTYGDLIELINKETYKDYSLQVVAPNGKIIAWNGKIAVPQNAIFPLQRPVSETFFYSKEIITHLTVIDTLLIESDQFYFIVSREIEKHYSLQNEYYVETNFSDEISNRFFTKFYIDYNPFTSITKDGRKYSFELLNNAGNKIGLVTLIKPALEISINNFHQQVTKVQSALVVLAVFFLGLGFRRENNQLKFRSLKLLLFGAYLALFRWLIFVVEFPSNFIEGPLTDPAYFASAFGMGIVKSPAELFITVLFVLIFSLKVYTHLLNYIGLKQKSGTNKLLKIIFSSAAALFFLLTFRGFAASVKSIIFDSTLRYFREPNLLPNEISLVMNLTLLMLGTAIVLLLGSYLLSILFSLSWINRRYKILSFWLALILAESAGIIYIIIQKEPLLTPLMSVLFIAAIFVFAYWVYFEDRNSVYNYVYAAVIASLISITLLNFFNLELERESLKTTAFEINRPNDNLLKFLVTETIKSASKNDEVTNSFSERLTNYDAIAFKIWSQSPLQHEAMNSTVVLLDKNKKQLGKFEIGMNAEYIPQVPANFRKDSAVTYDTEFENERNKKIFGSIIPIMERNILKGFIAASISFDLESYGSGNMPVFLESHKNYLNSVIDPREIKIFEFEDTQLVSVYGDIYPSLDQVKPILNANFSPDQETWLNLNLNNEMYVAFVMRYNTNEHTKTTAVLLREKHFTWNLFNFFKIFIIHSLFIVILFLILFLSRLKYFKYSFRAQLLISFLVISIIPVVILAIYNRQVVDERSRFAVFNELDERINYIENHIKTQLAKHDDRDLTTAFSNAGRELGISYGVYSSSNLIFNSDQQYYAIGLFPDKLDPKAYYQLNYLSYREFLTEEKVENYSYSAFYKKININGEEFIIGVNEAFNKVKITFSLIDVDVFLFGIYSFAVIIIIIISTLLANKISAPIRKLTKATEAVGHGDLNVELVNKEIGELRDLISSFNSMTRELQRNQAELAAMERESAWKEMAKQVAHEIKNPLTPMKLAVQQMIATYRDKSKNFEEIFEKLTSTILNQVDSLSAIASEFSRFAKMPNIKLEKVDLIPVAQDTINLFTDEKVNIKLNCEITEAVVEADNAQLRRMFINMIRNAIQANADKVTIEIYKTENRFEIIISDNGQGIEEEDKEKIFQTNFTTKEKGMGIGLKLVKRFVEGINSSIDLISSTPEGTIFKIIIPQSNNRDE